ncbi:hypothetical protein C3Y89_30340 [Rhizobium sp. UPM1132]|nr:hypothetical protein [Rhizobium ruizarguesonis]NKQ81950.1 hypothetical protein [Rhizobium ruizarguesonis]
MPCGPLIRPFGPPSPHWGEEGVRAKPPPKMPLHLRARFRYDSPLIRGESACACPQSSSPSPR